MQCSSLFSAANMESMAHWFNQNCLRCYFISFFTILFLVWGYETIRLYANCFIYHLLYRWSCDCPLRHNNNLSQTKWQMVQHNSVYSSKYFGNFIFTCLPEQGLYMQLFWRWGAIWYASHSVTVHIHAIWTVQCNMQCKCK